jgi:hypothetical protein
MPYRGWSIISEARAKHDVRVLDTGLAHWHAHVSFELEDLLAAGQLLQRTLASSCLEQPVDERALESLRAAMHRLEDKLPVLATLQCAYPQVHEELSGKP